MHFLHLIYYLIIVVLWCNKNQENWEINNLMSINMIYGSILISKVFSILINILVDLVDGSSNNNIHSNLCFLIRFTHNLMLFHKNRDNLWWFCFEKSDKFLNEMIQLLYDEVKNFNVVRNSAYDHHFYAQELQIIFFNNYR